MFENLKQRLMQKIQENSVESEMSYKDKEGVEHTEKVYLKRGKRKLGDWHQAYLPIRDDGTNRWHIPNALFGGTKNLIKLIVYLGIVALFFLAFRESSHNYNVLMNNTCVQSCLTTIKSVTYPLP